MPQNHNPSDDVGEPDNKLFFPFVAVDSETDHFPLGVVRDNWSSVALQREDEKRVQYEREARSDLMEAANELLQYAWTKPGLKARR